MHEFIANRDSLEYLANRNYYSAGTTVSSPTALLCTRQMNRFPKKLEQRQMRINRVSP